MIDGASILDIARAVTDADLPEILRRVCRELARETGAQTVSAHLRDPRHNTLGPAAGYRIPRHALSVLRAATIELDEEGFGNTVFRKGDALWSDDVVNDARFTSPLFRQFPHQSALVLPLVLDGTVEGIFYLVWWRTQRRFGEPELARLRAAIEIVGVLLRNARLARALEMRTDRLRVLAQINCEISSSLDVDGVLRKVAEATLALIPVTVAAFWLADEDKTLAIRVMAGRHGPLRFPHERRPLGVGAVGWVAEHRRPLSVPDVSADGRVLNVAELREAGLVSLCGLPVMSGDAVLGVLMLHARKPIRLSLDEEELLEALTTQAAAAIRNTQLYRAATGRAERLQTLLHLNGLIASTLDLDACLAGIAKAATTLMQGLYVSIWLVDQRTRTLEVGAYSDARGDGFTPRRLAFGEGGVGWVAAHREPLAVDDVFTDGRLAGLDWWHANGLRSFYGRPVVADGALVAVMAISAQAPIHIEGNELALLESFAALAAVAIRNARLFADERAACADAEGALEALQESEARHRALVGGTLLGICIQQDGVIRFANEALAQKYGYESPAELVGQPYWILIAPHERDQQEEIRLARRRGLAAPSHLEVDHVKKDGSPLRVEHWATVVTWEGAPAVLVTFSDISERVALEKQLRQAQKMEAVGRLAAGVAHDFNNLLTVIYGVAERFQASLHETDPRSEDVAALWQAAQRAAGLTRQLLAFSRRQVLTPRVISLNDVIGNVTGLLRRVIGEDIEVVTRLDPALGMILGDAGQVEQVLMNLAVNARHAMPDGGRLAIETANVEMDEAFAARHPDIDRGQYARLTVTDTGCGMSEETLANIFEPFFTTKEHGKGTGLGLAVVHGIVRQHRGCIEVSSRPAPPGGGAAPSRSSCPSRRRRRPRSPAGHRKMRRCRGGAKPSCWWRTSPKFGGSSERC